ncbi:signal recognition particle subunit SRP72 [Octopus sinensis]|uniref:Signal recognition particle subunit SRP72 n=1 Tax=Octopus sinensis TaxID=2607531 RepID=A0A6P7TWS6_9MOLL|nr:signal recognition particle subunit SRP72 [Octopus sinensis]
MPKNYDASVTPDPERWLPRRERSYYRGKRKDKNKNISKGTQGATSPAGDIDASKQTSGSEASSPRPAANVTKPSPQPANRHQQQQHSSSGRSGNNKKKKKGKR